MSKLLNDCRGKSLILVYYCIPLFARHFNWICCALPCLQSSVQIYSIDISKLVQAFGRQRRPLVEYSIHYDFCILVRYDLIHMEVKKSTRHMYRSRNTLLLILIPVPDIEYDDVFLVVYHLS